MAKEDEEFLEFMDTQELAFGKYKGETPEQVCLHDPGYVKWLRETVKPAVCSHKLYLIAVEQDDQVRANRQCGRSRSGWLQGMFEGDDDDIPF